VSNPVVSIPVELWTKFSTGEIDHFRYDEPAPNRSIAVYSDGREEEFDSEVTPELIAKYHQEERERWSRSVGDVRSSSGVRS
jgi:hypothetical protein